jgi:serine/threonine-protein kinase
MSRDDDEDETSSKVDPADLETRIDVGDGSLEALEAQQEESAVEELAPSPGHGSDAPTPLADEDDRTQLVTQADVDPASHQSSPSAVDSAAAETRVLAASDSSARVAAPPTHPTDTRVLEAPAAETTEDKTSPPLVTPSSSSAPTDPNQGLEPGMVLFGEYEIVSVLGVGGMGEVYRARHRRLDEFRAIKVMHADLSKKKGAAEFFYREAKALLAVRHPAVAHCHDLLSDDAGRVYLVMEMIEGIPLSKKMNEGPLSADEVAILGARVSHGLTAAHRQGVIHRDVSPDNIVLPNGRVQEAKLIDFGIAKILEEGEGTIVDGFKGKLSYASPEQLGFFGGKLDGRSDFYSLGLVLVAAALGRPMGMGTTVMEAVDARRDFQRLPDEVPMGLRSAIQPLLALDPKDRPQYVDRLFVVPGGVDGADAGSFAIPNRSQPESTTTESAPASRRGPVAAVAAAVMLLALVGGYWWSTSDGTTLAASSADVVEEAERASAAAAVAVPSETVAEPASTAVAGPTAKAPAPTATGHAGGGAVAQVVPANAAPKRLSASDRIKIIGLINNAKLALSENRLMTPPGDNAFDRYRRVLKLDPGNQSARDGLRAIADRYLVLAKSASGSGDAAQTRDFLARAREADPTHPNLASLEAELQP